MTALSITERTSAASGVAVNQADVCVIKKLLPLRVIKSICFLMSLACPDPPASVRLSVRAHQGQPGRMIMKMLPPPPLLMMTMMAELFISGGRSLLMRRDEPLGWGNRAST